LLQDSSQLPTEMFNVLIAITFTLTGRRSPRVGNGDTRYSASGCVALRSRNHSIRGFSEHPLRLRSVYRPSACDGVLGKHEQHALIKDNYAPLRRDYGLPDNPFHGPWGHLTWPSVLRTPRNHSLQELPWLRRRTHIRQTPLPGPRSLYS